jgi:hypothetical protein
VRWLGVGPEPVLQHVGEVDLDLELGAFRLGRRVLGRSSEGCEPKEVLAMFDARALQSARHPGRD